MNSTVIAAAGGAVAIALLDVLVEKGILGRDDAKNVIEKASSRMSDARGSELVDINGLIGSLA
jgi:hypothetical protein